MNNKNLAIGLRWAALLVADIFILSRLDLSTYIVPHIYFLSLLFLPVRTSKSVLLIFGFITGFVMDIFLLTGGLHAAATTFMALVRIFTLRFFTAPEDEENNISPGLYTFGFRNYMIYCLLLVFLHHLLFFWLEVFKSSAIVLILSKTAVSTVLNVFLLLCIQLLFTRPVKKNERRKR